MDDCLAALFISNTDKVGNVKFKDLIDTFGKPSEILNKRIEELERVPGISSTIANRIKHSANNKDISVLLKKIRGKNIKVIYYGSKDYPENLAQLYDCPSLLFVKGTLKKSDMNSIAIVGSRYASKYGKLMAEKLAKELSELGINIVSGFAKGIDTTAHITALKNGNRTTAVFGCGPDIVYPAENKKIYNEIIEKGCIISEYLPGTKPDATNFPARNRIISGLSRGIVVIQAGYKSGALITAKFGLDQNREIFAVPNKVGIRGSEGTNRLIKQGAKLVENVDDILNEIKFEPKYFKKKENKRLVHNVKLSGLENKVYKNVDSINPVSIQEIASNVNLTIHNAVSVLLQLEVKKLIKKLPGEQYIRN